MSMQLFSLPQSLSTVPLFLALAQPSPRGGEQVQDPHFPRGGAEARKCQSLDKPTTAKVSAMLAAHADPTADQITKVRLKPLHNPVMFTSSETLWGHSRTGQPER